MRLSDIFSYKITHTFSRRARIFFNARICAVRSASSADTFTSGSTPVPSQLVLVIGLIARPPGTNIMKWVETRHMPQVVDAMLMTGSFDYGVRVACIDQDDLVKITETLREKAVVRETFSRLILRKITFDVR